MTDEESWGELSSLFQLCTPLDGSIVNDVKSFMELLIDNLAGIVQYNGLQSEDIFSVCAVLTDESLGSPLERLGAVNTMMLGENGEECLDHTYETFIAQVHVEHEKNLFSAEGHQLPGKFLLAPLDLANLH